MPPRIPRHSDFDSLAPDLSIELHFPSPPESTTAILVLFHGLGDSEVPFANLARRMNLPGVLAIAVRGTSPLPPSLIGDDEISSTSGSGQSGMGHFHWGDDIQLDPATGDLAPDPGFQKAAKLVLNRLVREALILKCGWNANDVLLFGFGQGGSLALGIGCLVAERPKVKDITDCGEGEQIEGLWERQENKKLRGIISIGGPLPMSCTSTVSAGGKVGTPVLICGGRWGSSIDTAGIDSVKEKFANVQVERWNKEGDGMPRNKEEMLPIMSFFHERLKAWSF